MHDVKKLEEVEPFDLTEITSAMLENEELWKTVAEGTIPGESLAL